MKIKYAIVHSLLTVIIGISLMVAYDWYIDKQDEQRLTNSIESYIESRPADLQEFVVLCSRNADGTQSFTASYITSEGRQSMQYEMDLCKMINKAMIEAELEDD